MLCSKEERRAWCDLLARTTGVPAWAHALVATYFDNRPAEETQAAYRAAGAKCSQYWYHELRYLLVDARLHTADPAFAAIPHLKRYIDRYGAGRVLVREMATDDRRDILRAFCAQLGMHWSIFPYTVADFSGQSPSDAAPAAGRAAPA